MLAREDDNNKKEEDGVKGYLGQRRWAEGEGRDGPREKERKATRRKGKDPTFFKT